MKRKLDAKLAGCSILNKCGAAFPDLQNCETNSNSVKGKAPEQNNDEIVSLHQKDGPEYTYETCSTDMVIGNAHGENYSEPKSVIPSGGAPNLPNGFWFGSKNADDTAVIGEPCREDDNHANICGPFSSALGLPASVNKNCNPCNSPEAIILSLTSKQRLGSPERTWTDAMSVTGSRISSEAGDSVPSLSAFQFGDDDTQIGKKSKFNSIPLYPEHTKNSWFCYEPIYSKDLLVASKNDCFPSTDNYISHSSSPLCGFTTPTVDWSVSITSRSPESILRSSAMSYRNTPSIIRKRTSQIPSNSPSDCSTPAETVPSKRMGEDINSRKALPCAKQTSLTPLCIPEALVSVKPLGRCLEYAFDMEWDPSRVKCGTSVSSTATPDDNFSANRVLIP